jgi:hypothetical protein
VEVMDFLFAWVSRCHGDDVVLMIPVVILYRTGIQHT